MIEHVQAIAMSFVLRQRDDPIKFLHKQLEHPPFHFMPKFFPNKIKGNLKNLTGEIF